MDWDDMRRVAEAQKLLAGDCFFVKQSDWTLQMIERGGILQDATGQAHGSGQLDQRRPSSKAAEWSRGAFAENDPQTQSSRPTDTVRRAARLRASKYCQYEWQAQSDPAAVAHRRGTE
jgi:hypothetical protein